MDSLSFYLIVGFVSLLAITFVILISYRNSKSKSRLLLEFANKEKQLEELRLNAENQLLVSVERYSALKEDAGKKQDEIIRLREDNLMLYGRLENMKAVNDNLQEKLDAQKSELELSLLAQIKRERT